MLFRDPKLKPWYIFTVVSALALTAWYGFASTTEPDGMRGGSVHGLWFGTLAFGAMVFCSLLSLYKLVPMGDVIRGPWWKRTLAKVLYRIPFIGKWKAQQWLRAHLCLGTLSALAVFYHTGWRLGGPFETCLMAVFGIVYASGWVGLLLQQRIPASMTANLPTETFIGQHDKICESLRTRVHEAIATVYSKAILAELEPSKDGPVVTAKEPAIEKPAVAIKVAPPVKPPVVESPQSVETSATATGTDVTSEVKPVKPVSPALAAARAAAAAKAGAKPATDKPVEPLEPPSPTTAPSTAEVKPVKPVSPALAAARAAAAAKAGAKPATDKPVEPLEPPTPTTAPSTAEVKPVKPVSPALAAARAAAAAKAGAKPTTDKPPATETPAPAIKHEVEAPAKPRSAALANKAAAKPGESKASAPAKEAVSAHPRYRELLIEFYRRDIKPFLAHEWKTSPWGNPTPIRRFTADFRLRFDETYGDLSSLRQMCDEIDEVCEERRQLDVLQRYWFWLHSWLVIHAPLCWALFMLLGWHMVISLWY